MGSKPFRRTNHQRGASVFEYNLLALFLVVATIASVSRFSSSLNGPFELASNSLASYGSEYSTALQGGGSASTQDGPSSAQCDPITGQCPVLLIIPPTPPPGGWD